MALRSIPSDVVVIGYGSLMSGLGLDPFGHLHLRAASRLALVNARRGFGKFSQHGDRFAMVLEAAQPGQPIEARLLATDTPVGDTPEAIGLLVQPADLSRLCEREGYSGGAIQRLREEAASKGLELAAFLWGVFADVAFDLGLFRQRLFKLVGYTSPHYVPHPIRLDDRRFAITFLAPGREGTGSERIVPVRVRTGTEALLTISEAWRRKPNSTQLSYFLACLLGGVHGICVTDLLQPLAEDAGLAQRLRTALVEEARREVPRFLSLSGLDHNAYWQGFGPPTQTLRRSGLEQFLRG